MIRHRRWQDGVLVVDEQLPLPDITPETVAAARAEERRRRELVGGCCGGLEEAVQSPITAPESGPAVAP
jgi:hypothetical protein